MKKILLSLLLLLGCGSAYAQYAPVNCATGVACTQSGPVNTGTGDPFYVAFGKYNVATNKLFNMFGTGSLSSTGVASFADIIRLFANCTPTSPTLFPASDGQCHTASGAGGTPGGSNGQIQYNNLGSFGGLALVPITSGGTGTATPGLIAGTNVTITGAWPNQTINSTGGGGGSSAFSALTSSTNTSATMLVGTGATLAPTGGGSITANQFTGQVPTANGGTGANTLAGASIATVTGGVTSGHCAQFSSTFVIVDAGGGCGSGGSTAFSALTSSTNTTAAMVVGTGGSIAVAGSGTNAATSAPLSGISGLGTGVGTWLGTPSSANLLAALTSKTGTANAVFSNNPVLVAPALGTPASGTATNLVGLPLTTGVTGNLPLTNLATVATQTVLGNGSGSSASPIALALVGNLVATGSGLGFSQAINTQTGTSYTICAVAPCSSGSYTGGGPTPTDAGSLITGNNASATAWTLPAASATGFGAGFSFDGWNYGVGTITITTTTSTIGGASTLTMAQNTGCTISSDGTNYQLSACTAKGGGGSGSGTVASSTTGQVAVYTGSTTVTGGANFTASGGAMTLGVSGTLGSVKLGNATSGTVTIQPVTGALGSATFLVPAGGTAATIAGTETLTNKTLTAPVMTAPVLGTPASGIATNLTNLPLTTGVTGNLPLANMATVAAGTFYGNVTGGTAVPTAVPSVSYLIDQGTKFTATGTGACATITTTVGGTTAGKLTCTGSSGASTLTLTLPTAPNGWRCPTDDQTTANVLRQTSTTAGTCVLSGTVTANDVLTFLAVGY